MDDKQKFAFDETNFILLAIGMAVVILSFTLMTGPSSSEMVFQADTFSVRRIKMAPVVCFLGFTFMIYGVMRKPKTKEQNRMEQLEALVLGLIQGLTECLPIGSSEHLAISSALFGMKGEKGLVFTIVVHIATVFSTLVTLRKETGQVFHGLLRFETNSETRYVINTLISMIPIGIVGVFFKDEVGAILGSSLLIVGCMPLLTATLLPSSYYTKPRQKESILMKDTFIVGLTQACVALPRLSRSGSTTATGLLLGDNKAKLVQFSFLMMIPPILGEALLDAMKMIKDEAITGDIPTLPLIVGFVAVFASGCLTCKWVINIVKKGKPIYFAIYCAVVGVVTIVAS